MPDPRFGLLQRRVMHRILVGLSVFRGYGVRVFHETEDCNDRAKIIAADGIS